MEVARCAICGEEHPSAEMVTRHNEPEDVPGGARGTFPAPRDWWLEDAEAAHERHPLRLSELEIGDHVAFEPINVLAIDYTDEELGYAQDQWPVVDEAILAEDRAPDVVVRAPGPYTADDDDDEWWLLCRSGGTGPTSEGVARLTDLFPGLREPLRAGAGVWELAEGDRASARRRRVPDDELSGERWQRLFAWLEQTAQAMRGG